MKKNWLLVVLFVIFLCACSFVKRSEPSDSDQNMYEIQLLEQFDDVVKRATNYAKQNGASEVLSVFQNTEENLWRLEFENGLVVLYDEKTNEIIHVR
ncbi:hypothetical protein ACFSCX_10955 [Bacillus salitolerans]|uniref:PepSY domain-containing protein n=1 Tax=Bacillus salitolerans TaxID=1437434 RepID=A0ABW4LPH8_9BACI